MISYSGTRCVLEADMAIERWNPPVELTKQEQLICKHLARVRTLVPFLRRHRHQLFSDQFQSELEQMYRDTGAGKPALAPAMMAMATLLQDYLAVSDAELVKLTAIDLSVQMVLGHLGSSEAAFSQGAFREFRVRFVRFDMDRRLLEHTVELCKDTKEFDWHKLPKTLRVGIDSAPLEGLGRVEDTFNLLAHAARSVVACAAKVLDWDMAQVCAAAGIPLLLEPSIKAALDIDWSDEDQKSEALQLLTGQLTSLQSWLETHLTDELGKPPLKEHVDTLAQVLKQDLEPDPNGGGQRIREGVAQDRRISITDPDMRHGRKSKSNLINGYKQHLAADLDRGLVLSCAITLANRPECEAALDLKTDIDRMGFLIQALYVDRAYITSPIIGDVLRARGEIYCKPWMTKNGDLFAKHQFEINIRDRLVTCPSGLQTLPIEFGATVKFDAATCQACPVRSLCTTARPENGRSLSIAEDEPLQQRMRKLQRTAPGRAELRRRTGIEHRLARVTSRQGRRARYRGARNNLFALRRAGSVSNLQVLQRAIEPAVRKIAS